MLFAATTLMALSSALAQQPAQFTGRNQGAAADTNAQTDAATSQPGTPWPADKNAIRPFRVNVPQEALGDLRWCVAAT